MNLLQALHLIKEPNYTTSDQAEFLLDIGTPVDSADMYFDEFYDVHFISTPRHIGGFFNEHQSYKPCWSVGQLIKIYLICNPYESDDNLMFMLTSGVEVPDLCHYIITWLEYIKPNFDKVNEIIG